MIHKQFKFYSKRSYDRYSCDLFIMKTNTKQYTTYGILLSFSLLGLSSNINVSKSSISCWLLIRLILSCLLRPSATKSSRGNAWTPRRSCWPGRRIHNTQRHRRGLWPRRLAQSHGEWLSDVTQSVTIWDFGIPEAAGPHRPGVRRREFLQTYGFQIGQGLHKNRNFNQSGT